jgi:ribosomal protein S18 acetylase RimI-like enzyme
MSWLFTKNDNKDKNSFSNIAIYYNIQFPLDDILDVLHPLFGSYYRHDDFVYMIYTVNHIFCAYDQQGRCIACVLMNNYGSLKGLYIMLIGVRSTDQGRRIGKYLLEKNIQWAREKGYTSIHLHVHDENSKAIGLYEKVGFIKQGHVPNFYRHIPNHPPHAFAMSLSL